MPSQTPHSSSPSSPPASRLGLGRIALYLALLACAVALYLVIRARGEALIAPMGLPSSKPSATVSVGASDTLLHVLLALLAVIVAARFLGALFRRVGQPAVMGEIVSGILLGPSLFGRVAPEVAAYVLPRSVGPALGVISQIGIIIYMFLVGLELDPKALRKSGNIIVAISHASITVPFVMGSALALWLYPRFSTSDVPFTPFSLFLGASMSITAFPVLARILTDRGMQKTRLGVVALTCAAANDVIAWFLLAFIVGVVQPKNSNTLLLAAAAAAYLAVMLFVVRPLAKRLPMEGQIGQGTIAAVVVGLLASSLATEALGVHAVFGAFFLGALIPSESKLARDLHARLSDVVAVLLLPAFFALTGLRTELGLVHGAGAWLASGAIILVATIGKFGGSAAAAWLTGLSSREAGAIGVLMNTRGLMELIVLNMGLDLKIISPALFAMMVVMAIVTTMVTTPLLVLFERGEAGARLT